jgi:hypothetical protein
MGIEDERLQEALANPVLSFGIDPGVFEVKGKPFLERHWHTETHRGGSTGVQPVTYTFQETGVITLVTVTCSVCGATESLTPDSGDW